MCFTYTPGVGPRGIKRPSTDPSPNELNPPRLLMIFISYFESS